MNEYLLRCEDPVLSTMYIDLLVEEFGIRHRVTASDFTRYPVLFRTFAYEGQYYYLGLTSTVYGRYIIIDNFKEFREIIIENLDKIKKYENI